MTALTTTVESLTTRISKFAAVLGLHVVLATWILNTQFVAPSEPIPVRLDVRTIEIPSQHPQDIPKPITASSKPLPQSVRPVAHRADSVVPPELVTSAPTVEQISVKAAVVPQQAVQVKQDIPATSVQPVIAAARFDADYLQNPAPVFPLLSRTLREEGKALLLVQVTAKGEAEHVEIQQSSGYSRLDEAALNAVRKWRFVPARRGNEAVAAIVVVPMLFRLDN